MRYDNRIEAASPPGGSGGWFDLSTALLTLLVVIVTVCLARQSLGLTAVVGMPIVALSLIALLLSEKRRRAR